MTGEKILNYKIEHLTEENQLFRSFSATHTQFSKKVTVRALKELNNMVEKADFTEEVKKLAKIQHPNIVTLYDQLETSHGFYLIFEHVDGKPLAEHIKQISGPIPEKQATQLFIQILQVFELAHRNKIVNGAINSQNILLTPAKDIKVLDLALSNVFTQKLLQSTDKEVISYLSPEQIQAKTQDKRSDIYKLGMLLFEMLTGKAPYLAFNIEEIKYKISTEPLPSPTKFYPMVSPEMQEIIKKATAKKPEERFQTCEEFRQAILDLEKASVPQDEPEEKPFVMGEEEGAGINFSLILLGLLSVVLVLLIVRFNSPSEASSEVVFNLKDTERIKNIQDSLAKVQEKKALEDSIRVFQQSKSKDSTEIFIHKVKRGENLEKIAKHYHLPIDTLTKMNGIEKTKRLRIREGIKVKVRAKYKIKRGENLFTVAKKFNISPQILKAVNHLYPQAIKPGEIPKPVIFEGKMLVIPLMLTK